MMPSSSRGVAYLALAAVCVFWGTTYLGIRMALEMFPPAILVAIRFFISGAILIIAAKLTGAYLPRGRELWTTAFSGILVLGIGNGALAYAEEWVPSGLASLIVTLSPFWFVIFEALLPGGVKLHAPTIFGMVVGFAGTALLFLPSSTAATHGILAGVLVLQVGMIAWCVGSIYQKRQPTRAHPIVTGGIQQMASALAFAPIVFVTPHAPIVWKTNAVWAVIYLVIFGSIVGYSAYAYAIAKLPVAIVSIYPYVNSMVAVTLGWLFYREPFGFREGLAMVVIFAGVTIVKWQTGRVERQSQVSAA